MDEKLQTLLKQIKIPEDKLVYFNDGKLERIVGNKDKTCYTFVIAINQTLPVLVFEQFIEHLRDGFPSVEKTIAVFNANKVLDEEINNYFVYLMNRYSHKCPAISSLIDAPVEIKENTLIIYVNNGAEEDKLRSLEKKIVIDFRSFGYKIERINPILKEEPETIIEEQKQVVIPDRIERVEVTSPAPVNEYKKNYKPKPIETEDHPDVVLGRLIDTDRIRLDTITGPVNGVTLEAELFGLDVRETKTDLVIVTLKITDYTDSIYGKIFVNDKDEWNRLKKLLKLYYERRKNLLGQRLGIEISPNCFGKGLNLYHAGCIVVNASARIGDNCSLHGNNCIGNNGLSQDAPVIGDNVDIGFGASVIGKVVIADNTIIGANAVVTKSFEKSHCVLAGVPASVIR